MCVCVSVRQRRVREGESETQNSERESEKVPFPHIVTTALLTAVVVGYSSSQDVFTTTWLLS